MISLPLILAAAILTGLAAGIAAAIVGWPLWRAVAAGLTAFAGIVVWREIGNQLGVNEDFLPAISVGDLVSFVGGAIGPLLLGIGTRRGWFPGLLGGVIGLTANIVVL